MFGGATQYVNLCGDNNLREAKPCRHFGAWWFAPLSRTAIRASDLLMGVSASSTAAAVRDGVRRLRRLLLGAQTVAVASKA
jgi:hypothetical protein